MCIRDSYIGARQRSTRKNVLTHFVSNTFRSANEAKREATGIGVTVYTVYCVYCSLYILYCIHCVLYVLCINRKLYTAAKEIIMLQYVLVRSGCFWRHEILCAMYVLFVLYCNFKLLVLTIRD